MQIKPGEENAAEDAVNGRYEQFYKLRPGDVVLDIGAHVGYFSVMAAEKVGPSGSIYAFEPNPGNYDRLCKNCAELPQIHPINAAAWDRNGSMELFPHQTNSGGHSLFPFEGHLDPVLVKTINLGWWISNMALCPNFIKMDTECAELRILKSLLPMGHFPFLAMEIHTEELFGQCRDLLLSQGYIVLPEKPTCRRCLMFANPVDDIGGL